MIEKRGADRIFVPGNIVGMLQASSLSFRVLTTKVSNAFFTSEVDFTNTGLRNHQVQETLIDSTARDRYGNLMKCKLNGGA